ncbi:hypothetical protein JR316_0003997 [Psilocybe cubensis]|uniref:Restriction of telomere capping protein 4 C-terminal domain-containing protein n=2 Tax=Psilocybe cubensis TaxID=181762 RepID=A0A8H7Y6N6_PSICU|nr:hypothetical protein JR316_0003997 [Psilocybe cubensis]KAH9484515.1 hypothetical protein JR316_0003997 [Psilocybe cubensis]
MNPDNLPPDPTISPIGLCPGRSNRPCGRPMPPIAIYKATGSPSKRHLKGSLCQTCSDYRCLYTYHHTPAYIYEDAQRLLHRINFPDDPQGYPRTLRPYISISNTANHSSSQPNQTQQRRAQSNSTGVIPIPISDKLLCTVSTCFTKSGTRTQGSRTCIENKCKTCCTKACKDAISKQAFRKACHAHRQPENVPYAPDISTPASPERISQVHSPPLPPLSTQSVTQNISISPPPSPFNISASQVSPNQSPNQDMVISTPPATQFGLGQVIPRGLAQPVGGTWAQKRTGLLSHTRNLKSLKVKQHEMDEQRKRTCILVVYHTNGQPPIRLEYYIQSFPHFRLSDSAELMKNLELQPTTKLDYWKGEWVTLTMESVLTVEKGQRLILKIRPSLRETLEHCPGIEDELKLQPKTSQALLAQQHTTLVSPIRQSAIQEASSLTITHSTSRNRSASPILSNHIHIPRKKRPHGYRTPNSSDSDLPPPPKVLKKSHNLPPPPKVLKKSHNSTKQWPFDFKVYQIHNGFLQMQETLSKSQTSRSNPYMKSSKKSALSIRPRSRISVKDAFYAAFPDASFHKSTFYEHKSYWKTYDKDIVGYFVDMGNSKQATYRSLQAALKNPQDIPDTFSESSSSDSLDDSSSSENISPSARVSPLSHISLPHIAQSNVNGGLLTKEKISSLRHQIQGDKELLCYVLMDPEESMFFCNSRKTFEASCSQTPDKSKNQLLLDCIAYYGPEIQALIISELREMFPEDSEDIDMSILQPLTYDSVIEEVLFPETVTLLIQEDLRISMLEVMQLLQDKHAITKDAAISTPTIKEEKSDSITLTGSAKGKERAVISGDIIDLTVDSPGQKPIKQDVSAHPGIAFGTWEIIDLTLEPDSL